MKLGTFLTTIALVLAGTAAEAQRGNKEGSDKKGSKPAASKEAGSDHQSTTAAFDAPEKATSLPVGAAIPDVTVQDAEGNDVSLRALAAKQKTALIFYRGGWCPFCNKHLKDVQDMKEEIEAAGYQIAAISPDTPDKVREAVDKGAVDYLLLSDGDMEAARAFRVAFIVDEKTRARYKQMLNFDFADAQGNVHNSLPVPAFFLIDTDGKVTFEFHDPDYKVRLSQDEIRKAIR
jgi:peroxiredoxin